MSLSSKRNLIIIAGPTAVGKTCLSIDLAAELKTEILSADSRQFYKEIPIGTAAPSFDELSRVKHHFIGHLSIHDYYNVSMYEVDALAKTEELLQSHQNVILTGGSGLYISTFCEGIDDLPDADKDMRDELKRRLENEGLESLRMQLRNVDPQYYDIVDLANPKRIMRALEVFLATGQKYSDLRRKEPSKRNFNIIKIALNRPREELFESINKRADIMINSGWLEEAHTYYPLRHLNALNTVGFKELFAHFDGALTLDEAIEKIKTNTRRYAKRQITWFKKDPDFKWFNPDDPEGILRYIKGLS